MLLVSFLAGLAILLYSQKSDLPVAFAAAAAGALLGTVTELITPSEYDTVTVPAVIAAVLLLLARM